jgi:uncharacterized membrane protein YsdA (DUF1294 family)
MVPMIAVLIINLILVFKIYRYNKNTARERDLIIASRRSTDFELTIYRRNSQEHVELQTHTLSEELLSNQQKVQFIIIIAVAIWSVFSTIIYYLLHSSIFIL